jgi:hypothetical protein
MAVHLRRVQLGHANALRSVPTAGAAMIPAPGDWDALERALPRPSCHRCSECGARVVKRQTASYRVEDAPAIDLHRAQEHGTGFMAHLWRLFTDPIERQRVIDAIHRARGLS